MTRDHEKWAAKSVLAVMAIFLTIEVIAIVRVTTEDNPTRDHSRLSIWDEVLRRP
jgi:hypothetical protein